MDSQKILQSVASQASLCNGCPLNQAPYNPGKCVPGTGNPEARIFAIGEAPGEEESKTGLPFVGKAGGLLQELMIQAGYTASDVFIANAVKHRPPKNREPTPEERATCRPFLIEQLKAVNPTVILALGKSAAFAIAEMSGIEIPTKGLRGYVFTLELDGHRWPVFCTWHPAYVLRNPKGPAADELLADLQAVRSVGRS